MAHPIVHLDFAAHDSAVSSKFYADVFGWKITKDENFNYYMFSVEGGPGGGFVQIGSDYKQGEIIPYLGTQDIDADLKRVEQAGGKVLQPKMDIGDFGEFAMFADPAGNRVGLYASKTPQG
jgi:predicted enzyme related to lactoylglutathione lyase